MLSRLSTCTAQSRYSKNCKAWSTFIKRFDVVTLAEYVQRAGRQSYMADLKVVKQLSRLSRHDRAWA